MFNNRKHKSVEEMLRVIESTGMKREIIKRYFSTDKDITGLYHIIEKKSHAKKEQEMIRLLRAYVEKMSYDLLKSLETINQNTKGKEDNQINV
jgi:GTP-binding protein EngB required for normal cell division